jgi:hypothetical protein
MTSDVNWKEVDSHYAQYTPEEAAAMCTPQRCRACGEKPACQENVNKSWARFLGAQEHQEG